MKSRTTWRWNAVRGEYEAGEAPPLQGTGEISAIDAFSNKTMLLLGGTGFVGKVLLAMVLDRFPELKHLVVQVRRKKNCLGRTAILFRSSAVASAASRLSNGIGESVVRAKSPGRRRRSRSTAVRHFCREDLEQLKGKVDIVVNLAGVVDFDPPVNESVEPNVYGTQHLIELVQLLGAKLVHVSTAYVAGKKNGTHLRRHADRRLFSATRRKRRARHFPSRKN